MSLQLIVITLQPATANLLRKIIMVRDNFLTLPGWFTRDDMNDIIFSICVS